MAKPASTPVPAKPVGKTRPGKSNSGRSKSRGEGEDQSPTRRTQPVTTTLSYPENPARARTLTIDYEKLFEGLRSLPDPEPSAIRNTLSAADLIAVADGSRQNFGRATTADDTVADFVEQALSIPDDVFDTAPPDNRESLREGGAAGEEEFLGGRSRPVHNGRSHNLKRPLRAPLRATGQRPARAGSTCRAQHSLSALLSPVKRSSLEHP